MNTTHFQNGIVQAQAEIMNTIGKSGVKVANEMPVSTINKLIDEGKVDEAYQLYMKDSTSYKGNTTKEQFLRMWKKHFQGDSW